LKSEAARSVFPRLIDRNNDFWWRRSPDLTPAKNFDKAHISTGSCASKGACVPSIEERQLADCRK